MNFSASASNPTQYVKNEEMIGELMTAKMCIRDSHTQWLDEYRQMKENEKKGNKNGLPGEQSLHYLYILSLIHIFDSVIHKYVQL